MNAIADVQSTPDLRNLPINQVGIKDLHFPVKITSDEGSQSTVARLTMTVYLPADQKGTHMSRFIALMEEQTEAIDYHRLQSLTEEMLSRLNSSTGRIIMSFPFFRRKSAPVSGIKSMLDYDVTLIGYAKDGRYVHTVKAVVPVTSLCPCSKEISQYGAHNQRSHVTVTLTCNAPVQIEDIIDRVESQASCQLYGLLKRPDEKFVTEQAYENPKFVEDIVRDVAGELEADKRIESYTVESENFESIHNHSAYACISKP